MEVFIFKNRMIFLLLTLLPLDHTMDVTTERVTGKRLERITGCAQRLPIYDLSAEGANLAQAKPDETLRQKDPVPKSLWKIPSRDTDGVNLVQ